MNYRRVWAMPSKHTFSIKPIREFIDVNTPIKVRETCDPFCGESTLGKYRNDMQFGGIDGLAFLQTFDKESIELLYFDPPYSPRQLKECYNNCGVHLADTKASYWASLRNEIKRILIPDGICLSFGWNSVGVGTVRKFMEVDGQLVCYLTDYDEVDGQIVSHGGQHNDTICKAEIKV